MKYEKYARILALSYHAKFKFGCYSNVSENYLKSHITNFTI